MDAELAEENERREPLLRGVLGASGDGIPEGEQTPVRAEALLRLGRLSLRTGRPAAAGALYRRLADWEGMRPERRKRRWLGRLEAALAAEKPAVVGKLTERGLHSEGYRIQPEDLLRRYPDAARTSADGSDSPADRERR